MKSYIYHYCLLLQLNIEVKLIGLPQNILKDPKNKRKKCTILLKEFNPAAFLYYAILVLEFSKFFWRLNSMRQLLLQRNTNWWFERNVKYFLHSLVLFFCFCSKSLRRGYLTKEEPTVSKLFTAGMSVRKLDQWKLIHSYKSNFLT